MTKLTMTELKAMSNEQLINLYTQATPDVQNLIINSFTLEQLKTMSDDEINNIPHKYSEEELDTLNNDHFNYIFSRFLDKYNIPYFMNNGLVHLIQIDETGDIWILNGLGCDSEREWTLWYSYYDLQYYTKEELHLFKIDQFKYKEPFDITGAKTIDELVTVYCK